MPDDTLDIDERFQLLRRAQREYQQATRAKKSQMLDDLLQYTGLKRKTVIERLNGSCLRAQRSQERGPTYGPDVDDCLRVIAEAHDYICPERLHGRLVKMAEHLARHGELVLGDELRGQLATISLSTLRRRLRKITQDRPRLKRRSGPPSPRRYGVPIGRIPWDEPVPGHFEADLVHHCIGTTGEYIHTLHMVDVTTGWCEAAAVLGRSYLVVRDGFARLVARLPFGVRQVHTDNGGEFFTAHLARYFTDRLVDAQRTRSRAYHKNDARFVEQRNGHLIRGYVGYDRLDTVAQVRVLNRFYAKLSVYHNLFQPVQRLEEKVPAADGQRITRRHSPGETPFQRLCAAEGGVLSAEQRVRLGTLYDETNPRALRREMDEILAELWALPNATPECPEDAWETLYDPGLASEKGGGEAPVGLSNE